MYLLKYFQKILKFLSALWGAISLSLFAFAFIKPIFNNVILTLKTNLIYGILLSLIVVFFIFYIIYLFRENFSEFRILNAKENINEENIKLNENLENVERFNFSDVVPSDSLLKNSFYLGEKEAIEWSDDSKLDSFNVYFDAIKENRITIQIYFISEYKKQSLALYYPNYSREVDWSIGLSNNEEPFFYTKKWRNAFEKSFIKIDSRLGCNFAVVIRGKKNKVQFEYRYGTGELQERIYFDYDGIRLSSERESVDLII